ncbi:MAG TPA: hypothetical protein PLW86_00130 [Rhodocyclaceae bacterium]|nr:hypothetical protein [Rhodocyclaceae bacterium]
MNQASLPRAYDLVLVFTAFQRNCVYASIIKELARKYRIAILPVDRDQQTESRIGNTNRQFLDLCVSLGADIVGEEAVTARIEILAQSNYRKEDIERIDSMIQAQRTFWMSGVAMGNASYGNLFGKKIDKILVPDRRLYEHRIAAYGNDGIDFPEAMIQEVGIPYRKYPLFEQAIDADYILANPTPFSFVTAQDRLDYLENVYGMAREIAGRGEVIAFKPHNADERADYIVDARLLAFLDVAPLRPLQGVIDAVARRLARALPAGKVNDFCIQLSIAVVYRKLMSTMIRLAELTPYHNLNLEVFLPGVRKGLITGRSNSIWHALYLKKPVWNCIDGEKPYFSDTKMHRYAMTYLNVHGNHRNRDFDEAHYNVIAETTRSADLIRFLDEELSVVHQ